MKKDDTELIITNDADDAQEVLTPPETAADTPPDDTDTPPDDDVADDDGIVKEPEQSFRQALKEQIHEEDNIPRQNLSVMKVLGGDFFTAQILRRQIWLMLLILVFVIIYVSNRYSYQKSLLEIDKLKTELQDAKYKALSTSSALTEQSRQSNVLEMLKFNRDSVLHIADRPPFIINVPEE